MYTRKTYGINGKYFILDCSIIVPHSMSQYEKKRVLKNFHSIRMYDVGCEI